MITIATAAPGSACAADEFQCLTGDQCVAVSYHCDGEVDCQDESDEQGCSELVSLLTTPRIYAVMLACR